MYILIGPRFLSLILPVYTQFGPEQSSGPADPGNGTLYVKQRLLIAQERNHSSKVGGSNGAKPESRAKPEKERREKSG